MIQMTLKRLIFRKITKIPLSVIRLVAPVSSLNESTENETFFETIIFNLFSNLPP